MYRGNHPAKVDEKGRLKLPAAFKQLVDAKAITQFYVTSTDGEFAQVWPLVDWEEREKLLTANSDDAVVVKYLSLTSYYGQQVEMDNQGRVLIPQILRKAAALDDEDAMVIGMGLFIKVQNRKRCEQEVDVLKISVEENTRLAQITKRNP